MMSLHFDYIFTEYLLACSLFQSMPYVFHTVPLLYAALCFLLHTFQHICVQWVTGWDECCYMNDPTHTVHSIRGSAQSHCNVMYLNSKTLNVIQLIVSSVRYVILTKDEPKQNPWDTSGFSSDLHAFAYIMAADVCDGKTSFYCV